MHADPPASGRDVCKVGVSDPLQPGCWCIHDHPNGWDLRFRPPQTIVVPGLTMVTSIITRLPMRAPVFWSCCFVIVGLLTALEIYVDRSPLAHTWILALLVGALRYVVFWEFAKNAKQRVVICNGMVHTSVGMFPVACLRTLRRTGSSPVLGWSGLVFRGSSLSEVVLIGGHGVPDQVLQAIQDALLVRCREVPCRAANDWQRNVPDRSVTYDDFGWHSSHIDRPRDSHTPLQP